jgi:predicted transcriptional regulator of viral defense system
MNVKDELAALSRISSTSLVTASDAAIAWQIAPRAATRRLAVLANGGWVRRLRRGTYEIVPLDAASSVESSYDDPWVLASHVFRPCYIGGWSAAEHWGLTEQLFRETFVVTAASVRAKRVSFAGLAFRVARVSSDRAIGDANVWRQRAKVTCSSRERTLVDGANNPLWVGGVRHLSEMLQRHVDDPSRNGHRLAEIMQAFARGSGAKRLGYIAESLAGHETGDRRARLRDISELAFQFSKSGVVRLDPSLRRRGRMSTRWGLWVNTAIDRREHS